MSLYSTAVKKPITTLMVFVGVVVMGIYSMLYVPIDLFPELEPPIVSVFTFYQGANATEIEQNITKRLEDRLNTISNLKTVISRSKDNVSLIMLEFEWGTNLDEAANSIRDAISMVERYLPEDAEKPAVFKFSSNMVPILMLSATANESYPAIRKILDEKIVNPLNRIDGVGSVSIMGGPIRSVLIEVDPRRLEAYNLSVEQLGGIIRAENLNLPSGNIEMGMTDYPLRVQGEFTTSDEIKNIVIGNFNGKVIFLNDVASITDTIKKLTVDERTNGRLGVRIMVQKQSGANTVSIAEDVNKKLNELTKELPPDITVETIFDSSDFITRSINNLATTLMFAGIFVILVVLFFLGRWRATFIIILTIPVSLIAAFIYLFISGNTINIISLSALSIAIGMVVDDAIVVLENITRHVEKGSYPKEASIYGTNEVGLAVVATTLTVVAVFFPMTLIGGMTGILFNQLGWIVTITVTVSTIAALSLTPMLSSKLLKTRKYKEPKGFVKKLNSFWGKVDNLYESILKWSLRHKVIVISISVLVFVASFALVPLVGTEFMPPADDARISASIELNQGVRIDETKKVARQIEQIINEKYPEIELISTNMGAGEGGSILTVFQESASHIINFTFRLSLESERERSKFEISDLLREDLDKFPEIASYYVGDSKIGSMMGMGSENNIEVKIFGYDFNETGIVAEELSERMKKIDGLRDVTMDRSQEKAELQISFDRDKMAAYGLNTATVASNIRNRINGLTATKFREEGNEYDVIVKYADEFKTSVQDIENINIKTPRGFNIKLKEVATLGQFYSPPTITRENRVRVVSVSALIQDVDLGTVTSKIRKELTNMDIPSNIDTEIGGSAKDMEESFTDLGLLLILSIVLVYIVMASQFESFREPFIIMLSLPFAFTGVILALYITGITLNVISLIGGIMLVGIVVKNAIVMIDFTNLMRDRGTRLTKAVILAGKSRLRPVLMTTFTTMLGMLPLALSQGEGSDMWRPMGVAIIGGLLFSTMVTLIFVPVIYSIFGAARAKKGRKASLRKNENSNNKLNLV
ncbi:MAG: efflux RND transporter permease subunit [Bacteroidales bacterium]|nr:efflux RND transporter permease subunit [Bacteroidales bacterium]